MAKTFATLQSEAWTDYLNQLNGKLRDKVSLLKLSFSTYGFKDIIDHFKKESGSMGKWKKRDAKTQAAYARNPSATYNPSNKLLQLTGNLRGSILPSGIKKISSSAIQVFANASYSGTHDRGSKKKNIPKREFMWLCNRAKENMAKMILKLLDK